MEARFNGRHLEWHTKNPGKGVRFSLCFPVFLSAPGGKGFDGGEQAFSPKTGYEPDSHTPKIVFLLGVMIGEGNRHRRLAGAAGYLSRMRVIGIGSGGSGDGTREMQSGCGGRKLLALAAAIILADVAAADGAAGDVLDQFEQMAVLHLFDAVGKNHKPAIDFI